VPAKAAELALNPFSRPAKDIAVKLACNGSAAVPYVTVCALMPFLSTVPRVAPAKRTSRLYGDCAANPDILKRGPGAAFDPILPLTYMRTVPVEFRISHRRQIQGCP
jgi:hypothetical protein